MMIYLFMILLVILCLYLTNDTWKYFKIRKTDIKGSRIELYYIFCLTSIILSSISKLILSGYIIANEIALILFIISVITGAIAFLYFVLCKKYFQEKKKLILNIIFYVLVVWYIVDNFLQISILNG